MRMSPKPGCYKLYESVSPCLFFGILVANRRCKCFSNRLYPSIDVFNLFLIGGGLLQEMVSGSQLEEMLGNDERHSS